MLRLVFITLLFLTPPSGSYAMDTSNNTTKTAIFAGGCFWCMEPPFDALDGVIETTSGYTGGETDNPTYKDVSAGITGHTEAIEVTYNPEKVSYETLLDVFWKNIDPLDAKGQFCDRGTQYRSGIFYHNEQEKEAALASLAKLSLALNKEIATEVTKATTFYPAEDYHQDYYKHNPIRYKFYRYNCGRDKRLKDLWG